MILVQVPHKRSGKSGLFEVDLHLTASSGLDVKKIPQEDQFLGKAIHIVERKRCVESSESAEANLLGSDNES
ncbi:hypothetical protein NECAME_16667 [Necator americanus]|uniref:Uncharacterized protein n=1 Tax=Necator americanus TaxID=51031 RepID=W2TVE9_NECAM|nr:hypothetical protein NECAME_16667 [Necator americanus]ETN85758.1 hypothetical protein NECAME_16667 [Necator americanus]